MSILQFGPDKLTQLLAIPDDDADQVVSWRLPNSFVIAYLRVGIAGNTSALRAGVDCAWSSEIPADGAEFEISIRRPFGHHDSPLAESVDIMKLDTDAQMFCYMPPFPIFQGPFAGENVFSVKLHQDGTTTEAVFASIEPAAGCGWLEGILKRSREG